MQGGGAPLRRKCAKVDNEGLEVLADERGTRWPLIGRRPDNTRRVCTRECVRACACGKNWHRVGIRFTARTVPYSLVGPPAGARRATYSWSQGKKMWKQWLICGAAQSEAQHHRVPTTVAVGEDEASAVAGGPEELEQDAAAANHEHEKQQPSMSQI